MNDIEPGFMNVSQTVIYGAFPSRWALYKWVTRSGCKTYRRGKRLLFTKRDIDDALRPEASRHFFTSVERLRRPG